MVKLFQNCGEESGLIRWKIARLCRGGRLTAASHIAAEARQDENHLTQVPADNADRGFVQRVPECAGNTR